MEGGGGGGGGGGVGGLVGSPLLVKVGCSAELDVDVIRSRGEYQQQSWRRGKEGRREEVGPVGALPLVVGGILLLQQGHLAQQGRRLELGVIIGVGRARGGYLAIVQDVEGGCFLPFLAQLETGRQLYITPFQ